MRSAKWLFLQLNSTSQTMKIGFIVELDKLLWVQWLTLKALVYGHNIEQLMTYVDKFYRLCWFIQKSFVKWQNSFLASVKCGVPQCSRSLVVYVIYQTTRDSVSSYLISKHWEQSWKYDDISSQSKLKLRSKRRNKIYTN